MGMITFQERVNLAPFNTFGVTEYARWFTRIEKPEQIPALLQHARFSSGPHLILGGGSNVLFTRSFEGLIIRIELTGIKVIREDNEYVWIKAAAGENWHKLVMFCVQNNYGGIENLSLIPGTAGAAPIQNIGAYGVELTEVLEEVDGFNLTTGSTHTLSAGDCRFGYRDSIFKHELKEKFLISSITLRLTRRNHRLRTSYGAITDILKGMNISQPTIQDISKAVIQIRTSKLPDPQHLGNAGSFFKNPVIDSKHYHLLKEKHPDMPGFIIDSQQVKIPAAWLIEQCGWKGKRLGDAGVHVHQPLVLVNYGRATGKEILQLAHQIHDSVVDKFNIDLQTEVNII